MTTISNKQKKMTAKSATRSNVLFSGDKVKMLYKEKDDNPIDVNKINEVIILFSKFLFSSAFIPHILAHKIFFYTRIAIHNVKLYNFSISTQTTRS